MPWDAPINTPVRFKVLEDVVVDGCVIISKNAEAQGQTTSRMLPPLYPSMNVTMDWVACVDGSRLALRGQYIDLPPITVPNET